MPIAYFLTVQQVAIPLVAGVAQNIRTDGRTQTTVTTLGAVTDITTSTIRNTNAFNSFSTFNVAQGNTVNLWLPGGTQNLINIVRDAQMNVYGILNSIQDGKIGGNVYFADAAGFVVGRTGVVNVGSLSLATPTQAFVNNFFQAPGNPDDSSVSQLLSGTAPRGDTGLINIQGQINALDGIGLSAGSINVGGTLYSGARFIGQAPNFTDVVNANGLASATKVVVNEGRIQIVADNDVEISGTITAPGGSGVKGGAISIQAGNDVDLTSGANLSARGDGPGSSGGTISVYGGNNASFQSGATIDASAGSSGDGGAIEFSAKNLVTLSGGQFRADAPGGKAGSVLIDPTDVSVTVDQFTTEGADMTITATNSITLTDVDLSTRMVLATVNGKPSRSDEENGGSTGNSGNLLLQAPDISVTGSKLLSYGNNGFSGGDITLDATSGASSKISVVDSTLKGANVTLGANASFTSNLIPVVAPGAISATIDVESSTIQAVGGGNVKLDAAADFTASTTRLSPLATIAADSTASVNVGGTSQIITDHTGNATLAATSTVTDTAVSGTPNVATLPADAGVAVNVVGSTASTHIGGSTSVNVGGKLELDASNTVAVTTTANASAGGATALGGTVAVSEVTTTTQAYVDGSASVSAGSIALSADSANTLTTAATAATKGATKQADDASGNPTSQTEQTLAKYKKQASTSDGSVQVAAAVAVADVNSATQTYVASNQQITSNGAMVLASQSLNSSAVTADGSTAGGTVGVGAAVGLNLGVMTSKSYIADNSLVTANGITLSALTPGAASNAFTTDAKSGAGASNVGVAGALAVNVLVDSSEAYLQGDPNNASTGNVKAGGGAVLLDAENTSSSTATAEASVAPASGKTPAAVGVGASVGLNVAVDTTRAEVEDGAILNNAGGLTLKAIGDHTMTTTVTGGSAGSTVSVTPTAAVSVEVDTTTARLGSGDDLSLGGDFTGNATQTSTVATTATGQTQGGNVAVGASLALTTATDTVTATIARNLSAGGAISIGATSTATSSTGATASAAGGQAANDDGSSSSGKSIDDQVTGQGAAADAAGTATDADAGSTLAADQKTPPKAKSSDGEVTVAAAVGVNVEVATTTASIGSGLTVSAGGALKVASANQTNASASADGSQTGSTAVGVGAAVALNLDVDTNQAFIADQGTVKADGVTVSAVMAGTGTPVDTFAASATSGAGASKVGVAGSLAIDTIVNTTSAYLEGNSDPAKGAQVDAGNGAVLIEAQNASSSAVTSGASVTAPSGSTPAAVGVGASVGLNVGVNTTTAEVQDGSQLTNAGGVGLNASADETLATKVTGGAAGAKVSITPTAAVTVAVDTTTARLGTGSGLTLSGDYASQATQTTSVTTTATGQTQGNNVAVGASLALTTDTDTVTATIARNLSAGGAISIGASSTSTSSTSATASAAGGQAANDDGSSSSGKSVDDQVTDQGAAADAAGSAADPGASDKLAANQKTPPKAKSSDGEVTVAAAVGVNVEVATTTASIGSGLTVSAGGALKVASANQTNASASADGSQTGSTAVGVGAAVALNLDVDTNQAFIADQGTVKADGVTVSAVMAGTGTPVDTFAASATSGAGASKVGVAGSLAIDTIVNTTSAYLEGNSDPAKGAQVDAGNGAVLIEAQNASSSTVTSGASVTAPSGSTPAAVGVGASVGLNVGVNTTTAEIQDGSQLTNAGGVGLNASADETLATKVTGGAAGAKVSITPTAAVTVAVDTTTARLGTGSGLTLSGDYASQATQTTALTTTATGQTQGDNVAVGASLALTTAVDTVTATIARDLSAGGAISIGSTSTSASSTSATASVSGGKAANSDGSANSGESVDDQVQSQGDTADAAGSAADPGASDKLAANKQAPPKAKSSDGEVSVAAAIGVNVDVASNTASIGSGLTVTSGKLLTVAGVAQTSASATADGSQTGDTKVGIGAAVALNVGTATNDAVIDGGGSVTAQGVTVSALMPTGKSNAFSASATSGAGASGVGVAGSLALNVVLNTTEAHLDGTIPGGSVNAGGGDVTIQAGDTSASTVTSAATVAGSGSDAKVGVGASFGVNVVVDTTTAEVGDGVSLTGTKDLSVSADADHTLSTSVTGGASGASVNITPLASVAVALNTTTADVGTSATDLSLTGALSVKATQTDTVTTTATGQTSGDVAVGASLAATVAMDHVSSSIGRNVDASASIDLEASSTTALTTTATASAKGAASNNDASGKPAAGTTPDEQKDSQLNSAESQNSGTSSLDLSKENDSTTATTPDTNKDQTGTSKNSGAKVSVAAAIGVGVAENQAEAGTAPGLTLNSSGNLGIKGTTDTNYATMATGEAVSDKDGIAAAVALTATLNITKAELGAGTTVNQAGSITIAADSTQNLDAAFLAGQASAATSGASGGEVAVAGALAVVVNGNETLADIGEGAQIGQSGTAVGNIAVTADDTSRISAAAMAGAISKGSDSKAGVGASFAVLVAGNETTAAVGYGSDGTASDIDANSLSVVASKHPVELSVPFNLDTSPKDKAFLETLANPATYLSQSNDYTEAVAGSASQGNAAVSGSFSVNVFGNITSAYLDNATVTTTGVQAAGGTNGVQIASHGDTDAISVAGAVAAAKQAGVGISNTDIVNSDQVLAAIEGTSTVTSAHSVQVDADAKQNIVNVSISAGAATSGTGVGGVLGVIVTMNKVEASIGDGTSVATVKSEGDVAVTTANDTTTVMAAGGIGAGNSVGVGASIAVNIVKNETLASIGQDSVVDAAQTLTVSANAAETAVTAVVAGAGGGDVGVAGALSVNTILADTEASVGQGAQLNTDKAYAGNPAQAVAVTANDATSVIGVAGGLAGGGDVGVGAALDTTVLWKTVKASIADDADGKDAAVVDAAHQVGVSATSTDSVISVTAGFAGGGDVGVGGAVSIAVVKNDVEAGIGQNAVVVSGGNAQVAAGDDITAVLTAGSAAGGGDVGVGGSIAVATLLGTTKASIGAGAQVTALGNGTGNQVYTGTGTATELASGLSVTANTQESLVTTVAGGAGGGDVGVAATVSGNVIASDTEAIIGNGASINPDQTGANAAQQVRVKAIDDTSLVNTVGAAAGGGDAGVGAAANVAVIAKTTSAEIGTGVQIKAVQGVDLSASSQEVTVTSTFGLAGGGAAGVGGSVAGVVVDDTTSAVIDDGTSATGATHIAVSGGGLGLQASDTATSTMLTGAGAGGGEAGVGLSLAVSVNLSHTEAKIGDYAVTSAAGATDVQASSFENLNTITVAGAGGGAAGVAGTISVQVVASDTEAGIGQHAQVNQSGPANPDQSVNVQASDQILTIAAGGAGAGGGAAGVGGSANVTFVKNTTTGYIDNGAKVSAAQDVAVGATESKSVSSATIAGAGGGAAGVAGAVSVIAVGSLLDDQATSGLQGQNTTSYADSQTTSGAVGNTMGTSDQSTETAGVLKTQSAKFAISGEMAPAATIPHTNTQAYIGFGATVDAGRNVDVAASDSTLAIVGAGSGAGGGAAGVAGSFGIVLLHDSAEAFIADGAMVNAKGQIAVDANTSDQVYNVGLTGSGGGAADVSAAIVVNVVTSDTAAYVGAAEINQDPAYQKVGDSLEVNAGSATTLVTVAVAGGGSGAASVGGVLNTNVLSKDTEAYIGDGAEVSAQSNVGVTAASQEDIVNGGISIRGAGAAAVSGVAAANVVDNTTQAYIGASRTDTPVKGASVDSQGNVTLAATDDTLIVGVSAVGNGAGAAAVGGNVSANVIMNDTEAYVSGKSTVNARGDAAGVDVYNGSLGAAGSDPAVPTMPGATGGPNGKLDVTGSGSNDVDLSNGASVQLKDSQGNNEDTSQGIAGKTQASPTGGLGAKTVDTGVTGLSVTAVSDEKIIPVTVSIAGAGAAALTGSAAANVVTTTTAATIGDGVKINAGTPGADQAVRLTAADNTMLFQTAGTVSGAGAAALSGAGNVGIIGKTTTASIGDSSVNASDLSVHAASSESITSIEANLSVAGAAGLGGAVGVDSIKNTTTASIGAGATIDATGDLAVAADQTSAISIYTVSGAGGIVGVSGGLSVGLIDNTTQAFVADSTATAPTTLDAGGTTSVAATSSEAIKTVTISGAGGGVGVAGAVAVKIVTSTTDAHIGADTLVNTHTKDKTQDVDVSANDTVNLTGDGGTVAVAGVAGVGATAEINIVRNTTDAYLGAGSDVNAGEDVNVSANSTKSIKSTAIAASGGLSVGIGGAVAIAVVGSSLDSTSQGSINGGGGSTATSTDSQISTDNVSGQLGSSDAVQGMKGKISTGTSSLGVSGQINSTKTGALDSTQAYVGDGAQVTTGRDISVLAGDKTQINLVTTGAAAGFAGIGGAVGVADSNSSTEAFIGDSAQISAGRDVLVDAKAGNVLAPGSQVISTAGAGGVIAANATVAVIDDTSVTEAYLGDGTGVPKAPSLAVSAANLTVSAETVRQSSADAYGASAGAIAVGASVATAIFAGETDAMTQGDIVATVGSMDVKSSDGSIASAQALAGAAGIVSGSGSAATATVSSLVNASLGSGAVVTALGEVTVSATGNASTLAQADGVNVGAFSAGVSIAVAQTEPDVTASIGSGSTVTAGSLTVIATQALPASGNSAEADTLGAAGGGLVGVNGTSSTALNAGTTTASVGDDSTLSVAGADAITATSTTSQAANAGSVTIGYAAIGADVAVANSTSITQALLGSNVTTSGGTLAVSATGQDSNTAKSVAGTGGFIAGSGSVATAIVSSHAIASLGSDDSVVESGLVKVAATEKGGTLANAAGVDAGVAAVGASVAVAETMPTVTASIGSGSTVTAGALTVVATQALPASGNSAEADTTGAAGGLVGATGTSSTALNAGVTTASVGDNSTLAISGADAITASSTTSQTANAGSLAIGFAAIGTDVSVANSTSDTQAYLGNKVTTSGGTLAVSATGQDSNSASAVAAAGGIISGSGSVATATVSSHATASLGSGDAVVESGLVSVAATENGSTLANASGVNAGVAAVGVSVALAETMPTVTAFVGTGTSVTASDLSVAATQGLAAGKPSAEADTTAASGGLIGINGTSSTALNSGTTTGYVGDDSTLDISGTTLVSATETTRQRASAVGKAGGVVAIGADTSIANSSTTTSAYLGDGVTVTGIPTLVNGLPAAQPSTALTVSATGSDDNFAYADAGTGGVIAGSAAVASTSNNSTTTATTGSGAKNPILVDSFDLTASHTAVFNSQVDSTNASLAGASGAVASNTVGSTVTAGVGDGALIEANSVVLSAWNEADKEWLPPAPNTTTPDWNINSGSGGAISGPAGISATHITQNTTASIGDNASVHVLAPATGVGVFTMDATNRIIGDDQVQLNSGGLIALAEASSEIYVDQANATVSFGNNTTVLSDLGDIDAGARSWVDLDTLAVANTYGLAGAPAGQAYSVYNGLNSATVGTNTLIQANWGNVTLAGGDSSAGVPTSINALSTVNMWNKTAIPIDTTPDAETTVHNNASLTIAASSVVTGQSNPYGVEAAGDINLAADQGSVTANAVGVGKDIYREALAAVASAVSELFGGSPVSFDYTGGTTSVTGQGQVTVNGTVLTGIQRDQAVTLTITNFDPTKGTWDLSISQTSGVGTITITPGVSIAGAMETRIANLQALALKYAGTAAADAYNAEITFIEYQMVSLGLASWEKDASGNVVRDANNNPIPILGTSGGTGVSPYSAAQALLASFQKQETTLNSLAGNWSDANAALTAANTALGAANGALTAANTKVSNLQSANAIDLPIYQKRNTALQAWQTAITNKDSSGATTAQNLVLGYETTLSADGLSYTASPSAAGAAPLPASLNDLGTYQTSYAGTLSAAQNAAAQALAAQKSAASTQATDQATFTPLDNQKNLDESDPSGNGKTDTLTSQLDNLNSQIATLQGELNSTTNPLSKTPITGPTATFVTLPDITAKLGSIHVKGTSLTGTGNLEAPGDAKVTITNYTPDYLIVKDITIDTNQADVTFNNVLVNGNSDINKLNPAGSAAGFGAVLTGTNTTPSVTITSNYNPTGTNAVVGTTVIGYAPDIQLTGDISNPRGPVSVKSLAGSILSQGSIDAGTVDVEASNGDFVQSYSSNPDNFFDVGGDPMSINTNVSTPGGIVANGSVFLAARYLNINGLVQSGIADWNLNLPAAGATLTGTAAQLDVDPNALTNAITLYESGKAPAVTKIATNDGSGLSVTFDASQNLLTVPESFANADYKYASATNPGGLYKLVTSQYGNIGAAYDPANDRYVIDGTQVKGGYIQLFGQVMNTSTNGAATGMLNVLDGYGQINITNNTQKAVVLETLDTGSGAAGVINIADIQYVDPASQAPHFIDTTITRLNGQVTVDQVGAWNAAGTVFDDKAEIKTTGITPTNLTPKGVEQTSVSGARSATYDPQTGLGYVYTTGTDESIEQDYSYSGYRFFGSSSLQTVPNLVDYRVSGPTVLSNPVPLPNGIYLLKNPTGQSYSATPTSTSVPVQNGATVWTTTDQYTTTSWWEALFTFGAVTTYHIDFSEVTPFKNVTTTILKADNAIGVNFIGTDTGTINVQSAASVSLTGAINNKAGSTTIVAGSTGTANQNITQASTTSQITAQNLTLAATGSIGSAAAPVRTIVTGTTSATATDGNIAIQQTQGSMTLGTIEASGQANNLLGQVSLEASGDIAGGTGSLVQGNTIQLTSDTGKIGSIAQPLNLNVGFSSDATQQQYFGLTAKAQGDIGIQSQKWSGNANGDLLLNTVVSTGGDVTIIAPGQIIDNNPNQTINQQTWSELTTYWDSLSLVAGSKANTDQAAKVLSSFDNGRTQDYNTYWQIRNMQANPAVYDPGFQYVSSPAEAAALTAAGVNVATFDANRTAQYHTLNAEVGAYTTAYDAQFSYHATAAEKDGLASGNSWTIQELAISVAPGLLKDITNTNPVVKDPNVSGHNVVLSAGTSIGSTVATPIIINVANTSEDPSILTDAQKVALASAEFSDLNLSVPGEIQIYQRKPLNFAALTGLTATVAATPDGTTDAGNMFLASLGDGILDDIQAQGQVRIKVVGSITNESASSPALHTGDLVLEAANGGIGYLPDTGSGATVEPLRIQLAEGANLTARAMDNINLVQSSGDLQVQTIFSRGDLKLTVADGSILDAFPATQLNILANNIDLVAPAGSIGVEGNPLSLGINTTTGGITAAAGGAAYLNGPVGNSFNIASVTAGDAVQLTSDIDMSITGPVTAPGPIGLVAGGTLTMAPGSAVHAVALGVAVNAGELVMQDNGLQAASIRTDTGTVDITTLGDATVTGIVSGSTTSGAVSITSTSGRILAGHALGSGHTDVTAQAGPDAQLTMNGGLGIGDEPLNTRVSNLLTVSGGVTEIAAQGSVNLVGITSSDQVALTAVGTITGGSVRSADGDAGLTSATGGIIVSKVSGNTVTLSAPSGVSGDSFTATGGAVNVESTSGGISVSSVTGNSVNLTAQGKVYGSTVTGTVGGVGITSTAGGIDAIKVSGTTVSLAAMGDVDGDTLTASNGAVAVSSTAGGIAASHVKGTAVSLTAQGSVTGSDLTATSGGVSITSAEGGIDVSQVAGNVVTLSGSGSVTGDTLTGTGIGSRVTASSATGGVEVSNAQGTLVSLTAHGDVTGVNLAGTGAAGEVDASSASGGLDLSTVTGNVVNLTAPGKVSAESITGTSTNSAVNITSTGGAVDAGLVTANLVSIKAAGDITGDTLNGTGDGSQVTLTSTKGAIGLSHAAANVLTLDAWGSVTGNDLTGTGTASQVSASSATGDVTVSDVTAEGVSLSAPGTVTGTGLNVGSDLQLAGSRIVADVVGGGQVARGPVTSITSAAMVSGGSQVVTGSVTGFAGGVADSVNLDLSSPSGFALTRFWSQTGDVNLSSGWLSVASTMIGDRATFTNPITSTLVDQHNRSMQPVDVQLYSFGAPFTFTLSGNQVDTDAYVVYRDPAHQVYAPAGSDRGATEQTEDALTRSNASMAAATPTPPNAEAIDFAKTPLISYSGFPVSAEEEE